MKLRSLSTAALALLLVLLFLPVLCCVIFIGNDMDYYDSYKITTLYSNQSLLLFVIGGGILYAIMCSLMRKIPYNRYTVAGFIFALTMVCFIFYAVNVEISKCIAFYGGWDCGAVANSARWIYAGGELGYDDYYNVYSNNVPITWLLYKLYAFASSVSRYPYNPEFIWIQFQCLMLAAALFFSTMNVLLICKKISFAAMNMLVAGLFLGLSPWKIVPYTDTSTIAVTVFILFLYILFLRTKTGWRYAIWVFLVFTGVLGGIMKATCYIMLVAVVLADFMWILFQETSVSSKCKELTLRIVLFLCGLILAACCKQEMYETLDYEYDKDMEITWMNYLYIGLNDETTGGSSGEGLAIMQDYDGYSRQERELAERYYIVERLEQKGIGGLLDFWLRKQVMNFNDGTFSWFQEGNFQAWEYEDLTDSSWKEPLRAFYWDKGESYSLFCTISQGVWIFILLGVLLEAVLLFKESILCLLRGTEDSGDSLLGTRIRLTGMITFTGVFLFVMLFEGRARYLYNNVPVFAAMAVIGYGKLAELLYSLKARYNDT